MRLIPLTFAVALLAGAAGSTFVLAPASAEVVVSVHVAPPPLPLYAQPPIPGPGYLWLPGYWDYDDAYGYFWVPGTWVEPPRIGLLWTPGYWAYESDAYVWRTGYWAERVGFYGGVDYGFGYTGTGFYGSEWRGDRLFYNRSVTNVVNVTTITNVYVMELAPNRTVNHVSFNGGPGGLQVLPTPQQIAFGREPHVPPTAVQQSHLQLARQTPSLRETQNHGRPVVAATQQPAEFKGAGVVGARTAGTRPNGQAIPPGRDATAPAGSIAATPSHMDGGSDGGPRGVVGTPGASADRVPSGHDLPHPGQPGTPGQPGKSPAQVDGAPLDLHPNIPQHVEPRSMPQAQPHSAPQRSMPEPQHRQNPEVGPQHGPGSPGASRPF